MSVPLVLCPHVPPPALQCENVVFAATPEFCEKHNQPVVVKLVDLGMGCLYDVNKPITGARQLVAAS